MVFVKFRLIRPTRCGVSALTGLVTRLKYWDAFPSVNRGSAGCAPSRGGVPPRWVPPAGATPLPPPLSPKGGPPTRGGKARQGTEGGGGSWPAAVGGVPPPTRAPRRRTPNGWGGRGWSGPLRAVRGVVPPFMATGGHWGGRGRPVGRVPPRGRQRCASNCHEYISQTNWARPRGPSRLGRSPGLESTGVGSFRVPTHAQTINKSSRCPPHRLGHHLLPGASATQPTPSGARGGPAQENPLSQENGNKMPDSAKKKTTHPKSLPTRGRAQYRGRSVPRRWR